MGENVLTLEVLSQFQNHLIREEKSIATRKKYIHDVHVFLAYAADREVTKELTVGYKEYLQQQGYCVRSVNSMLAALNCLLDYMGWGAFKVKALRCQKEIYCPEGKKLSRGEYLRLVNTAGKDEQLGLILQTICGTGIRVSELSFFTVEAVQAGEVWVQCKSKTRKILLPGKLRKLLIQFAKKKNRRSGPVFVTRGGKPIDRSNLWTQMKKLCNKANVDPTKVFPHNLRKLFARAFYTAQRDIAKLADILGHSSIETTRIYIMTTGAEHRKQMEQLRLII